jgi:hypothetical protein
MIGFDVLPRHFYSEIPDLRNLRASHAWKRPYAPHVRGWEDLDAQLTFTKQFLGQCELNVSALHQTACTRAGEHGFGPVESSALRSFVMTVRPAVVLQVGCGVSTAVILQAAEEIEYDPRVICVEPYPSRFLQEGHESGRLTLWRQPAQEIVPDIVAELGNMPSESLLFVDSSHTLGPAGECTRLICEVLPRLKPGCYAHFHDITFPYDYPRRILDGELFFQHESALLMAFLSCNNRFRISASLSMLHYANFAELSQIFPGYVSGQSEHGVALTEGLFPSSCYIQCLTD